MSTRSSAEAECALVKPAAIIALGATAARSLFGRPPAIARTRGRKLRLADGTAVFVTVHPSFLLRIEDHADKEREHRNFVDLRLAAKILADATVLSSNGKTEDHNDCFLRISSSYELRSVKLYPT